MNIHGKIDTRNINESIKSNLQQLVDYELNRFSIRYKTRNYHDFEKKTEERDDYDRTVTTSFNQLDAKTTSFKFNFGFSFSSINKLKYIYKGICSQIRNVLNDEFNDKSRIISIHVFHKELFQYVLPSSPGKKLKYKCVVEVTMTGCFGLHSERRWVVRVGGVDGFVGGLRRDKTDKLLKLNKDITLFDLMFNNIDIYLDELPPCIKEFNPNKRQRND
jgi:hypothetical protein